MTIPTRVLMVKSIRKNELKKIDKKKYIHTRIIGILLIREELCCQGLGQPQKALHLHTSEPQDDVILQLVAHIISTSVPTDVCATGRIS